MFPENVSPSTPLDRIRKQILDRRYRVLAGVLALVTGGVVLWLATDLFPYHSANHDEGVYLQQAAMLLDGRLRMTPESRALREAVHPWFFVADETGLYPKYTPVPAMMFAVGKLMGGYRLALGAIATANVALGYAVVAEAFDRRTGALAAAIMAGAPLFLITSSVFLPYAPTMALNLLFALAYIRSVRRESVRYAILAGSAIGLAFFARPYTAVLFGLPFVLHAGWRLHRTGSLIRSRGPTWIPPQTVRYGIIGGVGLGFVGLTLVYNATLTGSPLVFPYEAFAPLDGLGFGRRRILSHEVVYGPRLALRTTVLVLWTLAADWFTAGYIGSLLAVTGMGIAGIGLRYEGLDPDQALSDRVLQVMLFGLVASVVGGNVFFWGNYNLMGDLADPRDGLVSLFGPFYHFDLLLPLSAFAAHGTLTTVDRIRTAARDRVSSGAVRVGTLVALAVTLPLVGAAEANALGRPIETHASYTEKYQRAYEPFQTTDTTNAVVFLPPEYGEWRNHPFQWLRNDPDLGGTSVYAISRGPGPDFAVIDAYPNRTYYRYRYHGEWTPDPDDPVIPILERVRLREGSELSARTAVAVPDRIVRASVAVSNGDVIHRYDYSGDPPDGIAVTWTITRTGVTVEGTNLVPRSDDDTSPVRIGGTDHISIAITITEPSGTTLTYRESVSVRRTPTGVEAIWPPTTSVCRLVTSCGLEGTYVPDRPETRPDGIAIDTTLVDTPRSLSGRGPPSGPARMKTHNFRAA